MGSEHYYIYCKGILGVKTNTKDFKWIYGSAAPEDTAEEYEKCAVKFDIVVLPDKKLPSNEKEDMRFQSYSWNQALQTIYYRRALPLHIPIGYNIRIADNTVHAQIGANYLKFIKNRTMNLHGVYYLLSDIANVMLLNLGYMTLYASCACHAGEGKSIIGFSAPGTGKTYLATNLCKNRGYDLVGEDIIITDGNKAYACPWTSSFKNRRSLLDSSFSFKNTEDTGSSGVCHECDLMYVVVLTLGQPNIITTKEDVYRHIRMLNGYLFHYYSSPIIKILGYFDDSYNVQWNQIADSFLKRMVDSYPCCELQCKDRKDFSGIVDELVSGSVI